MYHVTLFCDIIKILLKNIDYLAPTPNGRQRVKEKRKKDSKEEQVNEER